MAAPAPRAIAIALPLWQALRAKPFSGYVAGRLRAPAIWPTTTGVWSR